MNEMLPSKTEAQADLQTVLAAWHDATLRLQQTHEALRSEVCRLTEELEGKNRELARKNRLADLGQMASHVAHEVRNSLVPVTLYLSLLRRRLSDDSGSRDILDKIASGFSAVDTTVNDLLHFTAHRDPQRRNVPLFKLVSDVLASLSPQLQAQEIETVIDVPWGLTLVADEEMVRRAVLNLVLNSIDAMPSGGELVFTSYESYDGIELEIADSGPGLEEETARRAFEPFFSTKSTGTGLGLAIVSRVVEAHSGSVSVRNCPEGGAAFTLRFPRRRLEAAA